MCLGGGVALNGVANYRILKESSFENVHIPPSPGDAGSAVGCAQYLYFSHKQQKRILRNNPNSIIENIYVGPSYSRDEIKQFLDTKNIEYDELDDTVAIEKCAKLISEGNVVGWYQGKMEWGPRALGNRSILADPRREEMKDILNEKIKHRESFLSLIHI